MTIPDNQPRKYNLEERTALLGENILKFIKTIRVNDQNKPIIVQLIRSCTSVGANYMEATMAESKKDFIHKIGIVCKEVKETKHWLRMLVIINSEIKDKAREFWCEAHELTLIFSKSIKTAKTNK